MNATIRRRFFTLFTLFALLISGGAIYQTAATQSDARQNPPLGQLVHAGNHQLHIHCQGEGNPTVVLEAGTGNWSIFWGHVQPQVAEVTRVCAYDRAGYGSSELGPEPRTTVQIADELHALLQNAGVKPPYVLAGHSFGGYVSRVFNDRYPGEVVGVIFVDSAHPDQWQRLPSEVNDYLNNQIRMLRPAPWLSRLGLLRLMRGQLPHFDNLPAESQSLYDAVIVRPEIHASMLAEMDALTESIAQVERAGDLGDVLVVVVTAVNSFDAFQTPPDLIPYAEADKIWMELQTELVTLSSNSVHLLSETGAHYQNLDNPDLVSKAIEQVVTAVRTEKQLAEIIKD